MFITKDLPLATLVKRSKTRQGMSRVAVVDDENAKRNSCWALYDALFCPKILVPSGEDTDESVVGD